MAAINKYDAMKHVKLGTVVRAPGGQLCTVEEFDMRYSINEMPIKLKPLFGNAPVIDVKFNEVTAVLAEIEHTRPKGVVYTPDDPIYSRATMEVEVEKMKAEWLRDTGRPATMIMFSNVAVKEIVKWCPHDVAADGSWHCDNLFGLLVVVSIHVSHKPGYIIVG